MNNHKGIVWEKMNNNENSMDLKAAAVILKTFYNLHTSCKRTRYCFVFAFLHLYTVMIYNPTIWCHPEEDGFFFESKFLPRVVSGTLSPPLVDSLGI